VSQLTVHIVPIQFGTPEYDETVRLRYDVLREPLGLVFSPDDLAKEYNDWHLGAYTSQFQLLGCLVLTPLSEGRLKMRQVAVAPAAQRRGVGARLVAASEALALTEGFAKLVLNARDTAVPFYEQLGYQCVGAPFVEVGIPHRAMEKNLVVNEK
jgi:hypothetical protein